MSRTTTSPVPGAHEGVRKGMPSPFASNPQFQPYSLIRAMWKQKIAAAAIWVLVSGLTVFFVLQMPRTYQAETSVQVSNIAMSREMVQQTVATEMSDRLEQIRQRALSRDFLVDMMKRFNLHTGELKSMPVERAVEFMKDDIELRLDRGWGPNQPNTFRVSVQGKDPAGVAGAANYLADYFVAENRRQREEQTAAASDFFTTRMNEAKEQVEESESKLNQLKSIYAGELPGQQEALIATLSQQRLQLQGAQDALSRAAQNKLLLNNSLDLAVSAENQTRRLLDQAIVARKRPPAPGAPITSTSSSAPSLTEVQRAEIELGTLRQRYGEAHPDVRRARARLDEAKAREAVAPVAPPPPPVAVAKDVNTVAEESTALEGPESTLRTTLREQHEKVETLRAQIKVAEQDEEKLNAERQRVIGEIAVVEARIRNVPLREQEMSSIQRDYEMGKENLKSMSDRKFSAELARQLEAQNGAATFRILERARIPEEPIKPRRSLLAMGGSIFGLLIGLIAGVALEMRNQTLLGEWELPPGTPVLGRVVELHAPIGADEDDPRRGRLRRRTA